MCKINGMELKKAIKEAGMTQENVSMELGKSKKFISVACANGSIGDEALDKLCVLLDADRNIFLSSENEEFESYCKADRDKKYKGKRFKKCYTPLELEALFDEFRAGEDEAKMIQFFESTRTIKRNKETMTLPIKCLHFIDWQRDTNTARAYAIARSFDELSLDDITVMEKDGKYYVVDGAHRAFAHYLTCVDETLDSREAIDVKIARVSESKCRQAFLKQSFNVRRPSYDDQYRAAIQENVPSYVALNGILDELYKENIVLNIPSKYKKYEKAKGLITPSRGVFKAIDRDRKLFKEAIAMITNLNWTISNKAIQVNTIDGMMNILSAYEKDVPAIEERLKKNCFGIEYYNSYIAGKKKDVIFDTLVKATR